MFPQKRVMAVMAGVTCVALVSLKVLQDEDRYSALLEIIHKLHGGYTFYFFPQSHKLQFI